MKLKKKIIAVAFFVSLLFACGFPSEEQVKNDFRKKYPNYTPLSAIVGEGDGSAAYYHIRYKKPNDEKIYEQVWLYLEQEDGKIKSTSKGKETIVK